LIWSGRAAFKQRVAKASGIDIGLLPFNQELISYLRAQKAAGRILVLATAADAAVAQAVAEHLDLFDEVISSNGVNNLKGPAKAAALVQRFGERGFAYAGDSRADLPVWQSAHGAVVVNAGSGLLGKARRVTLFEAMRPYQWVKNLLVFIPILTAHALAEWSAWFGALLMFMAFSATASGIYLANDLMDISADRRHPRKRLRPFARGALSISHGVAFAALLICVGLGIAACAGALPIIVAYAGVSLAYSTRIKLQPLADVFTLAALYTVRLVGGGWATGHALSLWLLAFSTFLFLSLALMKRVQELLAFGASKTARRGYIAGDEGILQMFGCASAFAASVVLSLFVQSETAIQQYRSPALLWAIVPLVLFWQCRLWLSTTRGYMRDDPIVYAARDWVSWLVGCTAVIVLIAARSIALPGL
jgi:4-hydroxybenzoate polyprenyltransferase